MKKKFLIFLLSSLFLVSGCAHFGRYRIKRGYKNYRKEAEQLLREEKFEKAEKKLNDYLVFYGEKDLDAYLLKLRIKIAKIVSYLKENPVPSTKGGFEEWKEELQNLFHEANQEFEKNQRVLIGLMNRKDLEKIKIFLKYGESEDYLYQLKSSCSEEVRNWLEKFE